MKIKICGITNLQDALDAIKAGANALGFVFYKKSPRYINPEKARQIVEKLPPFVQTVGLFVNEKTSFINEICFQSKMQLAQIIDDENHTDFDSLNYKYLRVVRAKSKDDILKYQDEYILVDSFVDSFGGAGKRVVLEWFEDVDCSKIVLAGGLTQDNLSELKFYNFFAVDVSSGVELSKGKKDRQKMIDFVKVANEI